MQRAYLVLVILFVCAGALFAGAETASAQLDFLGPLAPECGNIQYDDDTGCTSGHCTLCHLVGLAQNVINFFMWLAVVVATLLFVYAGVLYTTAGPNPGNIEKAHRIFWDVLLGLVFVLAAWLAIDIVMKTFYDESEFGPWNDILCPAGSEGGGVICPSSDGPFDFFDDPSDTGFRYCYTYLDAFSGASERQCFESFSGCEDDRDNRPSGSDPSACTRTSEDEISDDDIADDGPRYCYTVTVQTAAGASSRENCDARTLEECQERRQTAANGLLGSDTISECALRSANGGGGGTGPGPGQGPGADFGAGDGGVEPGSTFGNALSLNLGDPNANIGSVDHNSAVTGLSAVVANEKQCKNEKDTNICVTSTSGPGGVQSECDNGSGCTTLAGLRLPVIDVIRGIGDNCRRRDTSCRVMITGGTEPGHADGQFSHGEGYKLDLDKNPGLDRYIQEEFINSSARIQDQTSVGPRYTVFNRREGSMIRVIDEGTHWDLQVIPGAFDPTLANPSAGTQTSDSEGTSSEAENGEDDDDSNDMQASIM